ncbi:MAG TPA: TraR/DksA C4-type zinc finger protein [Chitinophagales bacterium]|nr:TraR/DksA C4-type zinc finger protein [Chitinophagales bacterium]
MAKQKGKDTKKAAKPAKTKSKPVAKKAAKPAKKAAPTPKKAVKPVAKKAKPVAKPAAKKAVKAVKAKPVAKKKATAKPVAKKVAPKAKPVVKKAAPVAKPVVKKEAPVVVAAAKPVKPVKPKKEEVKRILKDDVKPFVKQLYKPQVTPAPEQKPAKRATMKEDLNLRYSDKELKEFKDLIDGKLASAREELKNLKEALENHTDSQAGNKAWNMEEGTDSSEMEYLMNQISRQHQYIRNLELALVRIENKTYGICRVTGKLIPKERLRIVPHATLSLEAKNNRKADDSNPDAVVTAAPPTDFAEGFED